MSTTELEKRLTAVERKLARLSNPVNASPGTGDINNWIDQIHDTFQNDGAYRKAARLGRQWRKSKPTVFSRKKKAPNK